MTSSGSYRLPPGKVPWDLVARHVGNELPVARQSVMQIRNKNGRPVEGDQGLLKCAVIIFRLVIGGRPAPLSGEGTNLGIPTRDGCPDKAFRAAEELGLKLDFRRFQSARGTDAEDVPALSKQTDGPGKEIDRAFDG